MAEFDLTEGEAKGLFSSQISQPTIDKIIDHPRGGFALGLLILEIRTQTALASFIEDQAVGAKNERQIWEAREEHLRGLQARLSRPGGDAGRLD